MYTYKVIHWGSFKTTYKSIEPSDLAAFILSSDNNWLVIRDQVSLTGLTPVIVKFFSEFPQTELFLVIF